VEKLNEKMRQNFLEKYGKQMEEMQLDVQGVKRKVDYYCCYYCYCFYCCYCFYYCYFICE